MVVEIGFEDERFLCDERMLNPEDELDEFCEECDWRLADSKAWRNLVELLLEKAGGCDLPRIGWIAIKEEDVEGKSVGVIDDNEPVWLCKGKVGRFWLFFDCKKVVLAVPAFENVAGRGGKIVVVGGTMVGRRRRGV